jgi:tetratricopeptide (TPR) repeat protein
MRRALILFLFFNWSALQVVAQPENVRVLMRTAEKKLQEKDYAGALEYNNAAMALCNKCYQLEIQKGRIYLESGELSKANAAFKNAYSLCNQCAEPYLTMAFQKSRKGLYNEAYKDLKELIDKDNSSENAALAYSLRGTLYGNQKRYVDAYANFSKAYEIKKGLYYLYRMLLHEIHTNQTDKVKLHLADFIIPDTSALAYTYYSLRGSIHSYMRNYDLAFADYSKSVQLKGNDAYSLIGQATWAIVLGKSDLAVANIEKAQLLKPNDKYVFNSSGFVKIHLKQYEAALKDFEKALAIDNTNSDPYNNMGYVYYLLGGTDNFKKALYYYDKAIEVGSDGYDPYWKYRDLVLPK